MFLLYSQHLTGGALSEAAGKAFQMLPRMRTLFLFLALSSAAVVPACAANFQSRIPRHAVGAKRLVAMPVVVLAYELDAFHNITPKPQSGATAKANLGAAVYRLVSDHGGRAATLASGTSADPLLDQFWRWGGRASFEIAQQMTGKSNFGKNSVGEWTFSGDLAGVIQRLDANQALFVVVRDIWPTAAHEEVATLALAVGYREYWLRVAVACVADLREGRMIWCESRVDKWGALSDPDNARFAVRDLLANLYRSDSDL